MKDLQTIWFFGCEWIFDYESFVMGMVDFYYSLNCCVDFFFFFNFKLLIMIESKVVVVVGKEGRRKNGGNNGSKVLVSHLFTNSESCYGIWYQMSLFPSGWASVESVWERSVWFDFLFNFLMKCVRVTEKLEVGYGA